MMLKGSAGCEIVGREQEVGLGWIERVVRLLYNYRQVRGVVLFTTRTTLHRAED
jgi:hypothetical protein